MISYTAFSAPAVAAGFASTSFGLRPTTLVYGIVVVVLGAAAPVVQRVRAHAGQTLARAPRPQSALETLPALRQRVQT